MYYRDLRDYLVALERAGKLVRVRMDVNKDTELHPMVRIQFRGLPESERKAFLFEKIHDVKGKEYKIPYVVCCMAGSREIYALGMQCSVEEISNKWEHALLHPIPPVEVESGPVQEEIHIGEGLLEHGGIGEFPVPISTPGYDNAPYLTAPYWVTRDPETGKHNIGTYRAQLKSPTRTGVSPHAPDSGLILHWQKCRALGKPLEAAVVLGTAPNIAYVSVARLPKEVDEYDIAGGIAGSGVEVVKCQTIDVMVPAYAEIVLEGIIPTDTLEPEAPFGEARGYMGHRMITTYFEVQCITHRKSPIYQGFLSQFPPSESSKLRGIAGEQVLLKYLKHDCGITDVLRISLWEAAASVTTYVVQMKKSSQEQSTRVLDALEKGGPAIGKVVIVVDDDINPDDPDMVHWALGRMMPHRDARIVAAPIQLLDIAAGPPEEDDRREPTFSNPAKASKLLIDATRKWPYPPVSLPKRQYMERGLELWKQAGLPQPSLREPWWGYPLGWWTKEDEEEADLAVQGEYYKTGEKAKQQRKKI